MTETLLARKLRQLIAANGPLTIAQYMAHCLGDSEHGYYMTRDPLGATGDFVTAPEVSQMFGEIVGAWLVKAWRQGGGPSPVRLVELGPGRGTLMADIFRVALHAPDFAAALSVHLVEMSPALRQRQKESLAAHEVHWHASFHDVPDGALLLVANEFFDVLPVRQFISIAGIWRERVVGVQDDRLAFGIGPATLEAGPHAPDGAILEVRPAADMLIAEIARRIAAQGGAALLIDYGHVETAPGETLQAVRDHAYADPLAAPGEVDLTAHVDFAALARSSAAAGAAVHGPMAQSEFLIGLGLLHRAGRLQAAAGARQGAALQAAVARLAGANAMGTLFKVLALTPPGHFPPPFARRI